LTFLLRVINFWLFVERLYDKNKEVW